MDILQFGKRGAATRTPVARLCASHLHMCTRSPLPAVKGRPSVPFLAALRIFNEQQFFFLRHEDLQTMPATALVKLLAEFSGLYTDESLLAQVEGGGRCNPMADVGGRPMHSSLSDSYASDYAEAVSRHSTFFVPYNALLEELVGPGFSW